MHAKLIEFKVCISLYVLPTCDAQCWRFCADKLSDVAWHGCETTHKDCLLPIRIEGNIIPVCMYAYMMS